MNDSANPITAHDGAVRIEVMTEASRAAILAHFLRLSADDRRMRFLRCMTDDAIAAHVAGWDFDDAVRLGIRDGAGHVVALAEAFVFGEPESMEIAFSTDPRWRRLGLARALEEALSAWAERRGVRRIVASCHTQNVAMRGFLQCVAATTDREDDEVHAMWLPMGRRGGDRPRAGGVAG